MKYQPTYISLPLLTSYRIVSLLRAHLQLPHQFHDLSSFIVAVYEIDETGPRAINTLARRENAVRFNRIYGDRQVL